MHDKNADLSRLEQEQSGRTTPAALPASNWSTFLPTTRLSITALLFFIKPCLVKFDCKLTCDSQGMIILHNPNFVVYFRRPAFLRLLTTFISNDPETIVGESFMAGDWWIESGKLEFFLAFLWDLAGGNPTLLKARHLANRFRFKKWQQNTPETARNNINFHYDAQNENNALFQKMLGDVPCYSSALFSSPDDSLEDAQRKKTERIIDLTSPRPYHRILDIGSGWGVLTGRLAEIGADVTGITLSKEQIEFCGNKAAANERYFMADYRAFFENNDKPFDRIYCVEVLDHVGLNQFSEFFKQVRDNLTDDGQFFLQLIVRPKPGQTSGWIEKHIYPGGYIASLDEIAEAYRRSGLKCTFKNPLGGFHYAETLRRWRDNFDGGDNGIADPNPLGNHVFYRKWQFFFAYSITAFDHAGFSNYHMILQKT